MVKKFNAFINESKDGFYEMSGSKSAEFVGNFFNKTMDGVLKHKSTKVMLRCHWAIQEFIYNLFDQKHGAADDRFKYKELIDAGNLRPEDGILENMKDESPNSLFVIKNFHETSDDVLGELMNSILGSNATVICLTDISDDYEEDFIENLNPGINRFDEILILK